MIHYSLRPSIRYVFIYFIILSCQVSLNVRKNMIGAGRVWPAYPHAWGKIKIHNNRLSTNKNIFCIYNLKFKIVI